LSLILRLAWRNLWRHTRRTWLTVGAIVFSNALLVFMISLQFGMYGLMIDNSLRTLSGHLQVQAPGYQDERKIRQSIPDAAALAARMRGALDLQSVAARATAFALASSEERSFGIQVLGVEPRFEPLVSSIPGLVREGRYLGNRDAAEIALGGVLARNLKVETGDELTILGSARDGSVAAAVVEVVGIFDSGSKDLDRSLAEIPLGFFQDTFYMQGGAHQIVLLLPELSEVDEYRQRVQALLPDAGRLVVLDWDELQPGLKQAIQADISSAFFMYAVLVILVAFSVLNTQLMSVLERTREFGIVMSLGLTPGRLARLVLLETSLLGAIGLLLGALAGGLLTSWFQVHGFSYPGMQEMAENFNLPARFYPQVTLPSLLIGPACVFFFSVLAALYPALRLHWLRPVDAMRAA